jgi:RNA polymerase sigma-70 factor (ECF subfamily)
MGPEIIKKAKSGDRSALTLLIEKHKDLAYNIALGIVKNGEDARDITQDSFLKVLENLNNFRNESKFSTWLYRIVYNQSILFIKNNPSTKTTDLDATGQLHTNGTSTAENDGYNELYLAINRLEFKEKNVILLFYLAEKSIREISMITGLNISNIKVILHRARKKLYNKLIEYEQIG